MANSDHAGPTLEELIEDCAEAGITYREFGARIDFLLQCAREVYPQVIDDD